MYSSTSCRSQTDFCIPEVPGEPLIWSYSKVEENLPVNINHVKEWLFYALLGPIQTPNVSWAEPNSN